MKEAEREIAVSFAIIVVVGFLAAAASCVNEIRRLAQKKEGEISSEISRPALCSDSSNGDRSADVFICNGRPSTMDCETSRDPLDAPPPKCEDAIKSF